MAHRPGTWTIVRIDTKSENDATWLGNQHVAVIDDGKGWEFAWTDGISLDEVTSNAHLIAAAPELLAALQGLLTEPYGCSLCDSGKPRNPAKGHQPDCPYEIARASVAKARGETT